MWTALWRTLWSPNITVNGGLPKDPLPMITPPVTGLEIEGCFGPPATRRSQVFSQMLVPYSTDETVTGSSLTYLYHISQRRRQ